MKKGIITFIILIIALVLFILWVKNEDTLTSTDNNLFYSTNTEMAKIQPSAKLKTTKSTTKSYDKNSIVILHTNLGNIKVELFNTIMPITAGNFETLLTSGFYNGVIFHRVIKGFMIQGGDPTGTGMGGPGYTIEDEFTSDNRNDRGTISMANAGPNTGGSQFFINLVSNNFLDTKHPAFGKVIEGMDIVDQIASVETDGSDRPTNEVTIEKAELL